MKKNITSGPGVEDLLTLKEIISQTLSSKNVSSIFRVLKNIFFRVFNQSFRVSR